MLMELLTGARGYLDVDERLRDQLGKELESNTPEPGRVREFADAHVSLNLAAQAKVADLRPPPAPPPAPGDASRSAADTSRADTGRCRYCAGELPPGRSLNFCPHCGQNLQVLNCPACGAEVEAEWKFCVACGKSVAT